MRCFYFRVWRSPGKGINRAVGLGCVLYLIGCSPKTPSHLGLRLMMDLPPSTLNPRFSLDARSQRINALLFRGLTRMDKDLEPEPDLSTGWSIGADGNSYTFNLRPAKDQDGQEITSDLMRDCLENYRLGSPESPLKKAFPAWIGTESKNGTVIFHLKEPDPYLPANVSLLRYFRSSRGICAQPENNPVIGSGEYRLVPWDATPDGPIHLEPMDPSVKLPLEISFVGDDNVRALKLWRGEVDVTQSVLSLAKTRWAADHLPDFKTLQREGVNVSYLAFNLRDPLLSRREVREALALAIDRESIVRGKLMGFCQIAGSLLSPRIADNLQATFAYDPAKAEKILDEAGLKRVGNQPRFTLHYKTTNVREGFENALLIRDLLAKIGVRIEIDMVEPAVFFASIRKGAFQLISSRWVGVADASLLQRTLHTGMPENYAGFGNAETDALLEKAERERDPLKRRALNQEIQRIALHELPYFPLWYWNNTVFFKKELKGLESQDISLSSGLEPLTHLHY